jgi:hypothetical protein
MIQLTIEQSFDFYLRSLKRCGLHLLEKTDNKIYYQIFDEFAIEYPASLSNYTLERLESEGIITSTIHELSKLLEVRLSKIDNTSQWNVGSLKHSEEWRDILQLSDEIKKLVYQYQRDVWGIELDA